MSNNKITYDNQSSDCKIISGFPKHGSTGDNSEGVVLCTKVRQLHSPDIELGNNIMKSVNVDKLTFYYAPTSVIDKQTFIDIRPEGNGLCYKTSTTGDTIFNGNGAINNRDSISGYVFSGPFWQDGIYKPITNISSAIATDYNIQTYLGGNINSETQEVTTPKSISNTPIYKVALWDVETSMTNQSAKSTNGNWYSTYNKKFFSYRGSIPQVSSPSYVSSKVSLMKVFLSGGAGSLKMSDDYYFVGNTNVAVNNNNVQSVSGINYMSDKSTSYNTISVLGMAIRVTVSTQTSQWIKNTEQQYDDLNSYNGWFRPIWGCDTNGKECYGIISPRSGYFSKKEADLLINKQLIQIKYDTSSSIILYLDSFSDADASDAVTSTCISYLSFDSGVEDNESVARGLKYVCAGSGTALELDTDIVVETYNGNGFYDEYETLHSYGAPDAKQRCTSALSYNAFSRTNKLGRYDNFEGASSNLTYCNNTNFNKYNNVFENINGFIEYSVYNHDDVRSYNTIFVSEAQNYNRFNDVLVCDSISMTSPMDGRYGAVVCIQSNQQGVYVIQNNAVAILDYNSRSVSQELGSYRAKEYNKCDYTYIDGNINVINNEEVVATEQGILLLSDKASKLLLVNAAAQQPIVNLSDSFGMNMFFDGLKKEYDNTSTVTALKSNKYTLLYSKYYQEVYITYGKEALTFSFKEGAFTSIYPYGRVKFIQENFYYRLGSVLITTNLQYRDRNEFLYSTIFGQTGATRPGFFYITWDIDKVDDPTEDEEDADDCYVILRADGNDFGNSFKRFQNIRFNGTSIFDTYNDVDESLTPGYKPNEIMLDNLSYKNNLCSGSSELTKEDDKPSNMKRKYDTWFCNLPRISYDGNGDNLIKSTYSRSAAAMTNDKPSGYFLLIKASKAHYTSHIKLSKLSVSYDEII